MKRVVFRLVGLLVLLSAILNSPTEGAPEDTWKVTQEKDILQIAYGSDADFHQYGALHLDSSFFRLKLGQTCPTWSWGTSVILLPAFWSSGKYYQGARITATWQVMNQELVLSIRGTIASLRVSSEVRLPPVRVGVPIAAKVMTRVEGDVPLDPRPGEAFKPVMLSSHISPTVRNAAFAFAGDPIVPIPIPASGWIVQPPIVTQIFGLEGIVGSISLPTIKVKLDHPLQITGWATPSNDPNKDNVGFWAASDNVLHEWSFRVEATSTLFSITTVECPKTIVPTPFPGVPGPGKTADSPDVTLILFSPRPGTIGLGADLKAGRQEVEIFFWMEIPSLGIPTLGKFFLFFDPRGRLNADMKETALGRGVITSDIKGLPIFAPGSPLGIPEIPVKDLPKGDYKIVLEFRDAATGEVVTTSTVAFRVRP